MSRLRRFIGSVPRPARRFVVGVLVMTVLTFAGSAYGWATRADRVDPTVLEAAAAQPYVDLLVLVDFKPQAFHLRQLQVRGTVGAATDTSIQLRRVSRADLEMLARTAWIARVQLLR